MSSEATPSAQPAPVAPAPAAPSTDGAEASKANGASPAPAEPKRPAPASAEGEPAAKKPKEELTPELLKGMAVRPYLEKTVVPVLLQGMHQLIKDRPDDPCEALARYLTEHNPRRKAAAAAGAAEPKT